MVTQDEDQYLIIFEQLAIGQRNETHAVQKWNPAASQELKYSSYS